VDEQLIPLVYFTASLKIVCKIDVDIPPIHITQQMNQEQDISSNLNQGHPTYTYNPTNEPSRAKKL
jgi:hypothetical protein